MRLEPGVLNHVLCILGISRQPVDDAEQIATMTLHERTKGLSVAVSGLGDGRIVALVHSEDLDGAAQPLVGFGALQPGPAQGLLVLPVRTLLADRFKLVVHKDVKEQYTAGAIARSAQAAMRLQAR